MRVFQPLGITLLEALKGDNYAAIGNLFRDYFYNYPLFLENANSQLCHDLALAVIQYPQEPCLKFLGCLYQLMIEKKVNPRKRLFILEGALTVGNIPAIDFLLEKEASLNQNLFSHSINMFFSRILNELNHEVLPYPKGYFLKIYQSVFNKQLKNIILEADIVDEVKVQSQNIPNRAYLFAAIKSNRPEKILPLLKSQAKFMNNDDDFNLEQFLEFFIVHTEPELLQTNNFYIDLCLRYQGKGYLPLMYRMIAYEDYWGLKLLLENKAEIGQLITLPAINLIASKKLKDLYLEANIWVRDPWYQVSLLHAAAFIRHPYLVRLLLDHKATPTMARFDNDKYSAMNFAQMSSLLDNQHLPAIQLMLLEAGDGFCLRDEDASFLYQSVEKNSFSLIKRLCAADLFSPYVEKNRQIHNPLHKAIEIKSKNIIQFLLSKESEWKKKGYSLLEAHIGDFEAPLHAAIRQGDSGLVKRLLECKAPITGVGEFLPSLLHYTVFYTQSEKLNLFHFLLPFLSQQINEQDRHQATPLHYAAFSNPAVIGILLESKADVNNLDCNNLSYLDYALLAGDSSWINANPLVMEHSKLVKDLKHFALDKWERKLKRQRFWVAQLLKTFSESNGTAIDFLEEHYRHAIRINIFSAIPFLISLFNLEDSSVIDEIGESFDLLLGFFNEIQNNFQFKQPREIRLYTVMQLFMNTFPDAAARLLDPMDDFFDPDIRRVSPFISAAILRQRFVTQSPVSLPYDALVIQNFSLDMGVVQDLQCSLLSYMLFEQQVKCFLPLILTCKQNFFNYLMNNTKCKPKIISRLISSFICPDQSMWFSTHGNFLEKRVSLWTAFLALSHATKEVLDRKIDRTVLHYSKEKRFIQNFLQSIAEDQKNESCTIIRSENIKELVAEAKTIDRPNRLQQMPQIISELLRLDLNGPGPFSIKIAYYKLGLLADLFTQHTYVFQIYEKSRFHYYWFKEVKKELPTLYSPTENQNPSKKRSFRGGAKT